jgi:crotonobetainyl-CoA:carnitine CoA-transferase CaiB-like acyl-CoA transferase
MASDPPALTGVRVLDLGHYIAAPSAAAVLAELGADVVKVEPIGGEQSRLMGEYGMAIVRSYNRGKRSVAVNLKSPQGARIVQDLASRSDVLVQNQRPGVLEAVGLGPDALLARHPRLVYLTISGFGSRGPSSRRPGFDIAAQAESGLMSITGEPGRQPQKVGVPAIDAMAGHLGAQAVLAALFRRSNTGRGAHLETSLLEAALHLQQSVFTDYFSSGREPQRQGNGQPKNAPAADLFETRDGLVVLSAYQEPQWQRLCLLLGLPQLLQDERLSSNAKRVQHRATMREALGPAFLAMDTAACVQQLSEAQIVVGAVHGYEAAANSPDTQASGILIPGLDGAGQAFRSMGLPYTIDGAPRNQLPGPAQPGADTEAVLQELGFATDDIARLRQQGVVG